MLSKCQPLLFPPYDIFIRQPAILTGRYDMLGHLTADDKASTQTGERIKGDCVVSCHKQASVMAGSRCLRGTSRDLSVSISWLYILC